MVAFRRVEQPPTRAAPHPTRKEEPDAPFSRPKARNAGKCGVVDVVVQETPTGNVARINVGSPSRGTTLTTDACRIHSQPMRAGAQKRTTIVTGRRLATRRTSLEWPIQLTIPSRQRLTMRYITLRIPHPNRSEKSMNPAKIPKRMTAQMKSYTLDPFELISIIGFLKKFKLACDINDIHGVAAIWFFFHEEVCVYSTQRTTQYAPHH